MFSPESDEDDNDAAVAATLTKKVGGEQKDDNDSDDYDDDDDNDPLCQMAVRRDWRTKTTTTAMTTKDCDRKSRSGKRGREKV